MQLQDKPFLGVWVCACVDSEAFMDGSYDT